MGNKNSTITALPAKFITFEGIEGCGKSTQSKMLHDFLKKHHIEAILTREVGGTDNAEAIRDILLYKDLLPMAELMLVMAARYEHMQKVIIPALKQGKWVICDRFIDSTACYQGTYPEIGIEKVYQLHGSVLKPTIVPDITILIDMLPEIALERALKRGENNKFEAKKLEFHQKVYATFKHLSQIFSTRFKNIEALGLTPEELHAKIIAAIGLKV